MKKCVFKSISLILSLLLLMSTLCVGSFAQTGTATTIRDTVLVLDVSGSMSGNPIAKLKEAAKLFCESVLNAAGTNRVAIVKFAASVEFCEFTSDSSILASYIDSLYATGTTNMYDGLIKAKELLESNSSDKAIKNIVIMADGLPYTGVAVDSGRYTSSDYDDYRYANAVYNAATAMHSDYNIYSLGFFHDLSGSNLAFGRRFMEDLQNAGYYDVTDVADLEFTFGDIAEDVTEDECPIIIIPGVMGSNLYSYTDFTPANRVWTPDYKNDFTTIVGLGSRLSIGNKLYVKPAENQVGLAGNLREYGTLDTYKPLVDELCKTHKTVYFFSYDWRNSTALSAEKLNEFIQGLKVPKVNLICHSLGGIVGSCYVSANGIDRINKIITCGTPYEGSPSMINIIQNWDLLNSDKETVELFKNGGVGDDVADTVLGIFGGLTKSVKRELPVVAELMPTTDYVNLVSMYKDSWKPFSLGDEEMTTEAYVKTVKSIVGESNYKAAQLTMNSIDSVNGNYGILADYDNAYFIIGTGKPTISSIKFQFTNNDIDEVLYESDVDYSFKGDGTVPYASATMAEYLTSNTPNVIFLDDTNHGGTATSQKGINAINAILSDEAATSEKINKKKYIVVKIACPVDAEVTFNGSSLNSNSDNLSTRSSFGRLDILGLNDEIKMLCLDGEDEYDIKLTGTAAGTMDYTIRWFDGDGKLLEEKTARGVQVTDGMKATTKTDMDSECVIDIDYENDGVIDKEIPVTSAGEQQPENDGSTTEIYDLLVKIIKMFVKLIYNFVCSEAGIENPMISLDECNRITDILGNYIYNLATQ